MLSCDISRNHVDHVALSTFRQSFYPIIGPSIFIKSGIFLVNHLFSFTWWVGFYPIISQTLSTHMKERCLKLSFCSQHDTVLSLFVVCTSHALNLTPLLLLPLVFIKWEASVPASLHPQLQPRQSDPQKPTQLVSICMRRMCCYFRQFGVK